MTEPTAVVASATRKASVAWIGVAGQPRQQLVWVMWQDKPAAEELPGEVLYLVTGDGEQPAPGLAEATGCTVTVRTGTGARALTWRAEVSRVAPGGAEWEAVVPGLLAKRLNLPDATTAAQRWASGCAVLRLRPTGELVESERSLPDTSLAAPPAPSPARTPARVPYTLHRVRPTPRIDRP